MCQESSCTGGFVTFQLKKKKKKKGATLTADRGDKLSSLAPDRRVHCIMGMKANLPDGFFDCSAGESRPRGRQMALWRTFRARGAAWKQLCTGMEGVIIITFLIVFDVILRGYILLDDANYTNRISLKNGRKGLSFIPTIIF